ncbi:type III-B CRISPR module-associated protein Cmr3 [Sulfurisphaera ohwakuensis]|uniref:CRISPR-associated protein Cmr3 n=1 Tax=Sulfurisphaera ohwakuensis TaxID=69656 RepID=A0A650CIF6_SULOH|nr:type III-B CRISPR module-associated protein Cmr3 [Sulfurisphaera ohwakuensis]MBB5253322.1 CRISPR-associated protein Cmr3 [Sulfurisphaera ohwakuensis]QGR17651.1 type III-B CRISPR module-associated protein Cmr3 [Sulfurisphaera ohwakuensis]
MKKIRIRPLEPLMLRTQGEFEPLVTGSHTSAQSLVIPRPSTIAGLLGYLKFNGNVTEDWLDTLIHQLGDDVKIYGTLIESDDENYFYPLRMGNLFALVNREALCPLPKIFESISERYEKWEKEIYDIFYGEKNKLFELIDFQDRIGIGLDRQKKTAKEHYLYTARYLSFKKEIRYVIFVEGNLELKETVVNFGGEGRIAKLEVEDEDSVVATNLSGDYYLVVSPILVPDNIIDNILEEDLIVMGKVDKISLGFNIAHNRRKEILTAVLEGSVIKKKFIERYNVLINNNSSDNDLFSKYEKIGYNTISRIDCQNMEMRKLLDGNDSVVIKL